MRGELKPGYKQTEVGVIPQDWAIGSLSHFWTVTDCKHVTAQFVDNGFPIASIKEVQSRFIDLTNAKQTTQQFYNLLIEGGRKPRVGDLILSRNATVGEVAQVAERHPPFAMGQDVCLLRKKSPEFSTDYLQAVFRSPIIANQLSDLMVGSTFKRVNVQQIKNFTVPMPSPSEQETIAEALSDADALIESLEQLIAKKRQIKQGAMQELLTGKKRLAGFANKPGYKQTEVGVIPEDWTLQSVGSLVMTVASGRSRVESQFGEYPVYGSTGPLGRSSRYDYSGRAILVARVGANAGKLAVVDGQYGVTDNTIIVKTADSVHLDYLWRQLDAQSLNSMVFGSGQPLITGTQIKNLIIPLPPTKAEQTAIATILSDMDAETAALEEKLAKARQLKQGMMQELLTGKTRLVESKK